MHGYVCDNKFLFNLCELQSATAHRSYYVLDGIDLELQLAKMVVQPSPVPVIAEKGI